MYRSVINEYGDLISLNKKITGIIATPAGYVLSSRVVYRENGEGRIKVCKHDVHIISEELIFY